MKSTKALYFVLSMCTQCMTQYADTAMRRIPSGQALNFRAPTLDSSEFRRLWMHAVHEEPQLVEYLRWRFSTETLLQERAEIRAQLERVRRRCAA